MWTFSVVRGLFVPAASAHGWVAYSGNGAGLNNPALERDPGVGPIPAGLWRIGAPLDPVDHLGPIAMPLEPLDPDAPGLSDVQIADIKAAIAAGFPYGRTAFFIHGDNAQMNHTASHGCIILPRFVRALIAASSDRYLATVH